MKSIRLIAVVAVLTGVWLAGERAHATFHFMQIEQVIGGVNGDTTAQAIQLRMRAAGQNLVSSARIRAWDAAGANPILLIDVAGNVANGATGSRVLLTTANFANYTNVPLVSNFTLTNPIPASYMAAGRLTFEDNFNNIYWSLSWGGAGYTGSTTGLGGPGTNDSDGEFGPSFAGPLPSTSLQALQFQGAATALSTNNDADYLVTAGAATFVNNAGTSFTLVAPPEPDSGDFNGDNDVDGDDFLTWQRHTGGAGSFAEGDANHNGTIDGNDLAIWETQYNTVPPLSGFTVVPEPHAAALLFCGLLAVSRHRQRCK